MSAKPEHYRSGHSGYVSEFDQFINDYLVHHPDVEEKQVHGWYIWWDHLVDWKDLEPHQDDAVPVKPYQYD